MTYQLRSKLTTVLLITLAWSFVSVVLFLQGYSALLAFNCTLAGLHVSDFLVGALITSGVAGLIGGSLIVFVWEKWLRSMRYSRAILLILATYTVAYFTVDGIGHLHLISQAPEVAPAYLTHLLTWQNIAGYLIWLAIVLATLIALLVNDKYGPGVFLAFVRGKYFQPTREERTIMFLDLRGSTSIAEQLGEEKFFNFIRDVFRIATPAMLRHDAEIYQYVGDEVILTWRSGSGAGDIRCIFCFFDVLKTLDAASAHFESRYGVTPEFKAGLHHGSVMVGEVGVVKRDIAYSGDVMNTTARIQAMCNELGVDLLLSQSVFDRLETHNLPAPPRQLGFVHLRGKQAEVPLYTM